MEKEKPDGTTIRVRRRRMMVQVNKQPGITIVVRPSNKQDDEPELVDEGPLSYEEIPVDESNPEDEKYDPTVRSLGFRLYLDFPKYKPCIYAVDIYNPFTFYCITLSFLFEGVGRIREDWTWWNEEALPTPLHFDV